MTSVSIQNKYWMFVLNRYFTQTFIGLVEMKCVKDIRKSNHTNII